MQRSTQRRKCTCIMCMCSMRRAILRLFAYICLLSSIKTKEKGILQKLELSHPDADSVTFHGDIFCDIESLTCRTHITWISHISDSISRKISPWNVTEFASLIRSEPVFRIWLCFDWTMPCGEDVGWIAMALGSYYGR